MYSVEESSPVPTIGMGSSVSPCCEPEVTPTSSPHGPLHEQIAIRLLTSQKGQETSSTKSITAHATRSQKGRAIVLTVSDREASHSWREAQTSVTPGGEAVDYCQPLLGRRSACFSPTYSDSFLSLSIAEKSTFCDTLGSCSSGIFGQEWEAN